ncbi:MAG: cell wall hydrolase [Bacillota bacterium]
MLKRKQIILTFLLATVLLLLWEGAAGAAALSHRVAPGDSLSRIADQYGISVDELIQANEIPKRDLIFPGQIVTIPVKVHIVNPGETMWAIAQSHDLSLDTLTAANPEVNPHLIKPGQEIKLPAEDNKSNAVNTSISLPSREGRVNTSRWNFTPGEIDLFARLVHSEAAGEPYLGLVAVAATVLNRIQNSRYPNTLRGVIYQVSNGCYQYSPVLDGRINLPAGNAAFRAVYDAMAGSDPSGGALGFYNPRKTSNPWVHRQPVITTIGNHIFFR